jgi:hypothetical protein
MRRIYAEGSAVIEAPAAVIYELIADYRNGHPKIVPPDVFSNMQVIEGGRGAGTIVTFDATSFGRKEQMRGVVTEPEPGHILVETYPDPKTLVDETTFTVTPLSDGKSTSVKISTFMNVHNGLLGQLEKAMIIPFIEKTYQKELKRIETFAREAALSH